MLGQIAQLRRDARSDPAQGGFHFSTADARGVCHDVWFRRATVASACRSAKARGLGLGLWRLGREDQRIWDRPPDRPRRPLAVVPPHRPRRYT